MILVSTPLNYLDAYVARRPTANRSSVWMIPFLAVVVMAFSKEEWPRPSSRKHRSWGAMMVYTAQPVLYVMRATRWAHILRSIGRWLVLQRVVGALLIYTFRLLSCRPGCARCRKSYNDSERNLRLLNSKLHEQSLIDPLTQIADRRRFEQVLEVEWIGALRSGWPISVVPHIYDFKSLNDRYGHLRGDECLDSGSSDAAP